MFAHRLYMLVSLILVIAILITGMEHAESDVYQYEQKHKAVEERRQYCGDNLSETLRIICHGVYNSRFKRGNQETDVDDYMFNNHLVPYKSIKSARRMLRFRRQSAGIYEECCLNPCSKEEMKSYCATP